MIQLDVVLHASSHMRILFGGQSDTRKVDGGGAPRWLADACSQALLHRSDTGDVCIAANNLKPFVHCFGRACVRVVVVMGGIKLGVWELTFDETFELTCIFE